jgi:hypothetical protein
MSALPERRQVARLRVEQGALAVPVGVDHHQMSLGAIEGHLLFASPGLNVSSAQEVYQKRAVVRAKARKSDRGNGICAILYSSLGDPLTKSASEPS